MKETSTQKRLWKMESKDFVELQKPFIVYHVDRPDDEAFCKTLMTRHNWTMERKGNAVVLSPPV